MQTLVNGNLAQVVPEWSAPRSKKSLRAFPSGAPLRPSTRHVLTGEELSLQEIKGLLSFAQVLKKERVSGVFRPLLQNRQLALFFEKPSLRTRVSFTVGMQDLGGHAVEVISSNTKGEEPEDTARVLSGYCHGIMARVFSHSTLERMAEVSKAAVINGLSDMHHPCQGLADALTLMERYGSLAGLKVAYVGDGNNVLHSLLILLPALGAEVRYACPEGYGPHSSVLESAHKKALSGGGKVVAAKSPKDAVKGAQAVYTDVWTSMGFEAEKEAREKAFKGYQVNEALYANAAPGAAIMHCLPMVRGSEISETLPDHPCSVIFQQSENRLHVQKALVASLLHKIV